VSPGPGLQSELSIAERRRLKKEQQEQSSGSAVKATASLGDLLQNPANPRESLPMLEELAATIRESGVAQALTVISRTVFAAAFPEHAEAVASVPFVVINGNRRLAAAQMAGLTEVPVYINTTAITRTEIVVLSLVENIQREPLSPLEELQQIEELKGILGTYGQVAAALGKSEGWVSQRRRLGNLAPEVMSAFQNGEITIEAARDLGKLKDHGEQLAAWKTVQAEKERAREAPKKPRGPRVKKVPAQSTGKVGELGTAARREACATVVAVLPSDGVPMILAALRGGAGPTDDAEQLASEWLAVASGETNPEDPFAPADLRAATALALAHCELRFAAASTPTRHDQAYLAWLVEHADYEATEPERLLLGDPIFTA
jgi:ParB family chromosome partitioning protein